jgi:hypothetical protein
MKRPDQKADGWAAQIDKEEHVEILSGTVVWLTWREEESEVLTRGLKDVFADTTRIVAGCIAVPLVFREVLCCDLLTI